MNNLRVELLSNGLYRVFDYASKTESLYRKIEDSYSANGYYIVPIDGMYSGLQYEWNCIYAIRNMVDEQFAQAEIWQLAEARRLAQSATLTLYKA